MDRRLVLINLIVTLVLAAGLAHVSAQQRAGTAALSTAFTYQGRLMDGAEPAEGSYQMTFRLFDAAAEGQQIGVGVTQPVSVTEGLFIAQLDFGAGVFAGGPRFLEVEVGGTALTPRQPLTAAPYALYAPDAGTAQTALSAPWSGLTNIPADLADGDDVGLTSVAWTDVLSRPAGLDDGDDVGLTSVGWSDVLSRPAGLDDGDDNTTYTPGTGLNLNGTTFSVNSSAVQTRVSGACTVGSSIRSIAADGTVTCALAEPRPRFTSSHTSSPDDAGSFMAFDTTGINPRSTIGVDGLPVIVFRYSDANLSGTGITYLYYLRVAHCNDLQCSSARVTQLDGSGNVGENFAITIGYDGLPIISYHDQSSQDLKVAHCNTIECTNATITTLEADRSAGHTSSIAVNSDGNAIISYYDATDTSLKVALCGNLSCTTAVTNTVHDSGDTGKDSSIALGVDGLPTLSFYNQTEGSLWVADCTDATCTSSTVTRIDDINDTGRYSSLAVGADGLLVIAYHDATQDDLKVARCANLTCTSATITTVDSGSTTGFNPSLVISSDGLPLIAYQNNGIDDLLVAHCQDLSCSSSIKVTVDLAGNTGEHPTITIGSDGLPIISYHYPGGKVLKTIHCGNNFCTRFASAR